MNLRIGRSVLSGLVIAGVLAFSPTGASAQSSSITYTYDALGRLVKVVRIVSGQQVVIEYEYDEAGNRKRVKTTSSPS